MEQAGTPRPVRVLLVEDSPTVREAIASEFEADPRFELVGQAASVAEARALLAEAEVAILDLGLPDGSGADLIRFCPIFCVRSRATDPACAGKGRHDHQDAAVLAVRFVA
jgi:chemotaxis response regulator CheB